MAERKGSRRVPAWVIDDWTFLSVSGYGSRWEGFTAALRGCVWDEQDRQTRQTRFLWVSKQTREKKKNVRERAFRVAEAFQMHRYRTGRRRVQLLLLLLLRRGGGDRA